MGVHGHQKRRPNETEKKKKRTLNKLRPQQPGVGHGLRGGDG